MAGEVSVCIPFPNENDAEIVYNALRIDKEPKRSNVQKELSLTGRNLHARFIGKEPKNLRTALSNFFDHLLLSQRTIDRFRPPPCECHCKDK